MTKINAIFIDFDHTLKNENDKISPANILALDRANKNNIQVFLTTGRNLADIMTNISFLPISPYVICCNGALIYDLKKHKVIEKNPINTSTIEKILSYAMLHDVKTILCTSFSSYEFSSMPNTKILNKIINEGINQVTLISPNYERMLIIPALFEDLVPEVKIANSSRPLLDKKPMKNRLYYHNLTLKNLSKGHAVSELQSLLKLNPLHCAAIGDSLNDLSMFEIVENRIAMANAEPKLIKESTFITKSNNEDGVAYYLNTILDKQI